jgi:2-polyprenyl-6-methoxyphenol hydroxylase-like FAD-dependent oxidoreductase
VGDAAMTMQPLASAGVGKALRDAQFVVRALTGSPREYEAYQRREFGSYLRQLEAHYALESRRVSPRASA